jgi:hypothetical protein
VWKSFSEAACELATVAAKNPFGMSRSAAVAKPNRSTPKSTNASENSATPLLSNLLRLVLRTTVALPQRITVANHTAIHHFSVN